MSELTTITAAHRFNLFGRDRRGLEPSDSTQRDRALYTTSDTAEKSVITRIRAVEGKRARIDVAARLTGRLRSEFMLAGATAAPLDQRVFLLDENTFKRFLEILDAPAVPNASSKAVLATKAPWET